MALSSSPPVLILGASARAAAQSALRAGCAGVSAIDLFADVDLKRIAATRRIDDYPAGFERVFDELPGDVWLYTGGLENYPALIDRLARQRTLAGNTGRSLRLVRDPFWLANCLATVAFRFPRTVRSRSETTPDHPWLKKPLHGSAGLGITLLSSPPPLLPSSARQSQAQYYYQEQLPGLACSAIFVAAGRSVLLGATRQLIGPPWTNAGPFVYAGNVGPLRLPEPAIKKLRQLGDLLAARAGLVGIFGVDFLWHAEEAWVLEVNPRYPASLEILERASGEPLLAHHFAACLRGELLSPPQLPDDAPCHGKAILYAREQQTIGPDLAARWLAESSGPEPLWADVPAAGTVVEPGQPVVTRFATGGDMAEVEQRLRETAEKPLGAE